MKRLAVFASLLLALNAPVSALDLSAMSDTERQLFRAEVRAYLLENPEILTEVVTVLELRQQAAALTLDADLVQINAQDIFDDGYSYVGGNPDGDIVMVEFLDYNCGYCKRAHPEVTELLRTDGNIRYIVKEFPILGDQSLLAARFAISVLQTQSPDSYARIHDELMTFRGEINLASLERLAQSHNLDVDAVMANMDSPDVDAVISQNHALARRMQINGTPSFIIGDQMMRGYVPLDSMVAIVAELRTQ